MLRLFQRSSRAIGIAAGLGAAGTSAFACAEPTSTSGKEGEYYVDLADGGYEVGYKGRDGTQVVEIYNKSGPAIYVGK